MGSKLFNLSTADLKRWGLVFLSGLVAYALDMVLTVVIPDLQKDPNNGTIVLVLTLVVDFLRRFATDTRSKDQKETEVKTEDQKKTSFLASILSKLGLK